MCRGAARRGDGRVKCTPQDTRAAAAASNASVAASRVESMLASAATSSSFIAPNCFLMSARAAMYSYEYNIQRTRTVHLCAVHAASQSMCSDGAGLGGAVLCWRSRSGSGSRSRSIREEDELAIVNTWPAASRASFTRSARVPNLLSLSGRVVFVVLEQRLSASRRHGRWLSRPLVFL